MSGAHRSTTVDGGKRLEGIALTGAIQARLDERERIGV